MTRRILASQPRATKSLLGVDRMTRHRTDRRRGRFSVALAVLGALIVLAAVTPAAAARLREKDLNLDIARRVQTILRDSGVPVVMTRTSDVYVSLTSRAARANSRRVDAF